MNLTEYQARSKAITGRFTANNAQGAIKELDALDAEYLAACPYREGYALRMRDGRYGTVVGEPIAVVNNGAVVVSVKDANGDLHRVTINPAPHC